MIAVKRRAAASVLAAMCLGLIRGAAPVAAAEKPIDSKLLATALTEVGGDEETWYRGAALFAFALEIGVSEEQFRQSYPGARLNDLPSTVLAALRKHVAGVNLWCGCFGDQRETGISLFVLATPPRAGADNVVPELQTGIHSDGIMLLPKGERFRIAADKLEAIVTERDATLRTRPTPIMVIVEQKKPNTRATKRFATRGLRCG